MDSLLIEKMSDNNAEQFEYVSHPNKTFVSYQCAKQLDSDQA